MAFLFIELVLFAGYKVPVIENLGATLDQFDTIDLTDNEIRKLDGFPLLNRLSTLLLRYVYRSKLISYGHYLRLLICAPTPFVPSLLFAAATTKSVE